MADYIYLLETRLSPAQQRAVGIIRTLARKNDLTVFLTGGAVRDLTGGGSVRDLDLTVQGNVSSLRNALEAAGAAIHGENEEAQRFFLVMAGGVRVELSSAMNVTYPQPGKPKYEPAALSDDLRTRDFTANAMAISLNDGSYGLLMDPLNGVADIENRELRLVSNYGFIEDPSRLIRAARLSSRLGWQMEERTRQRYDTAKEEGYISALSPWNRGYELEEIFHEEDPVRILRALEAEGWMAALFPALTSSKANTAALSDLAERQGQLQTQGILAQSAALAFPLVAAKLSPADLAALKQAVVRPGFMREVEELEGRTREFAARFASKEAASPSAAWKMLHETEPNLVLSLSYSSKTPSVQGRLKTFLTESPSARQKIPYLVMQEMRILPDLEGYSDLVEKLFFELMDGKLSTPEEMKSFLEPYSPPAPPPPINLRRARAKKEARPSRAKTKKSAAEDSSSMSVVAEEEAAGVVAGLMEPGTLTGPNRGPEPTSNTPLQGKVAPEPQVVANAAAAGSRAKKPVADTPSAEAAVTAKGKATSSAASKQPAAVHEKAAAAPSAKKATTLAVPAAGKTAAKQVIVVTAKPAHTAAAKKTQSKHVAKKAEPLTTAPAKSTAPTKPSAPAKKSSPTAKQVPAKGAAAKKTAPAKVIPLKTAPAKGTPAKKVAATKAPAKKAARR